jgi:hypothetical protein
MHHLAAGQGLLPTLAAFAPATGSTLDDTITYDKPLHNPWQAIT